MEAKLIIKDGRANITVYADGSILTASDTHPNWDSIIDSVERDAQDVNWKHLFSIREAIAAQFEHLSERVAVANDTLYFDGEPQDDSLATQTIRIWKEGGNFQSLVAFMENIASNPCEHSRVQLYDWLRNHNFTITVDGLIVGYKGVASSEGGFVSTSRGQAYVNGTLHDGNIPNAIGDVVEMPRNWVDHDPSSACSTGLHVGVYSYAQDYASRGALLEVHVNPRDVVSVPTDGGGAKIRVCRYVVIGLSEQERQEALLVEEDNGLCFDCGEDFTRYGCCACCAYCGEIDDSDEDDLEGWDTMPEPEDGEGVVGLGIPPIWDTLLTPSNPKAKEQDTSMAVTDLVTPGKPRFEEIATMAKRQKKGLQRVAEAKGWVLVGDDAKNRNSWKAPRASKRKVK